MRKVIMDKVIHLNDGNTQTIENYVDFLQIPSGMKGTKKEIIDHYNRMNVATSNCYGSPCNSFTIKSITNIKEITKQMLIDKFNTEVVKWSKWK